MKSGKPIFSWFFALLLFCSAMNAQQTSSLTGSVTVPRLVNFSGRATDPQGKAISGIAGATFAIYKEESGGSPLWLETQNVQADANGNYTIQLGATKPDGLPLDLFTSGEARWLGVTVNGAQEQPRILLLSVPYALKAADAETVGGLPPSAFVLAAPLSSSASEVANAASSTAQSSAPPPNSAVTGLGTVNFLPLWDSVSDILSSAVFQSGSGSTAKIGINTTAPASTLDVKGGETVRGTLSLPATGTATATTGKNSQPQTLVASSFNSSTAAAVNQTFQWQAEPAGNNTVAPSGTLNLLFGSGTTAPAETGLKLSSKGLLTFATGQTFPGTGTVTSVGMSAPSSDFTVSGSPVTKSGTLKLNWNIAPTSADAVNAIVKRDATGSFSAGTIAAASFTAAPATGLGIYSSSPDNHGIEGVSNSTFASGVVGENTSSGGNGVYGTGLVGVYGTTNVPSSYGVIGVNTATGGIGIYGSAPNGDGFYTNNNVYQDRSAGGWVKAMALVDQNGIAICFNSTLIGAPGTIPPCGFTFHAWGVGDYTVDFGFEVDDRFVSTTGTGNVIQTLTTACVNGFGSCNNTLTSTQVEVTNWCINSKYGPCFQTDNGYVDGHVYVIIY